MHGSQLVTRCRLANEGAHSTFRHPTFKLPNISASLNLGNCSTSAYGHLRTTAILVAAQILWISKLLRTIPYDTHLQRTCSNCLHHTPDTHSIPKTYNPPLPTGKKGQGKTRGVCTSTNAKPLLSWLGSYRALCVTTRVLMHNTQEEVLVQSQKCEDHVGRCHTEAREKGREGVFVMRRGHMVIWKQGRGRNRLRLYCAVPVNPTDLVTETFEPVAYALEDIPANAEVLISYTDNTMPRESRQLELSEKYFFACAYSPCGRTASHGPRYFAIDVARAFLVTAGVGVLGRTAWSIPDSDKSKAMISSLRHPHKWPIWPLPRQPLAALRLALVQSEYIPPRNLERALLHHLLQRLYPMRVVHGFKLANLLSQILGVDYRKVDWRLLRECAAQVGWSHGGGVVFAGVRGLVGVRLEDIVLEAEVEKIVSMMEDLT
ncbi:hypothetical protein HOY80DRAFT_1013027 [Tuber brumale]|nr:hypothetical protein HOY80DRAFT_1013027 [Tuber brumale]